MSIVKTVKLTKTYDTGVEVNALSDVDFELELIHRDEINVAYIIQLLIRLKSQSKKDKNQIITFNKINNFGSYLAGLIEGDGSFYIPDNIRNNKGKLNQASIEIVFTKYDLSLANEIKHQIGGGYLI